MRQLFVNILTRKLNCTSYSDRRFKMSDQCPHCPVPDCTVWPGEKKNEEARKKRKEEEEKKKKEEEEKRKKEAEEKK